MLPCIVDNTSLKFIGYYTDILDLHTVIVASFGLDSRFPSFSLSLLDNTQFSFCNTGFAETELCWKMESKQEKRGSVKMYVGGNVLWTALTLAFLNFCRITHFIGFWSKKDRWNLERQYWSVYEDWERIQTSTG